MHAAASCIAHIGILSSHARYCQARDIAKRAILPSARQEPGKSRPQGLANAFGFRLPVRLSARVAGTCVCSTKRRHWAAGLARVMRVVLRRRARKDTGGARGGSARSAPCSRCVRALCNPYTHTGHSAINGRDRSGCLSLDTCGHTPSASPPPARCPARTGLPAPTRARCPPGTCGSR